MMGNALHYQNQHVNQAGNFDARQIRPHSSSPVGQPQHVNSNNPMILQNFNQMRPNILTAQNPMLFSFQPI